MRRTFAAVVALGLLAGGCATTPDLSDWGGGPVTPSPIEVTVNPSALPIGDPLATGLVVKGHEMVLYLWGEPSLILTANWRDTATGKISEEDPVHDGFAGLDTVGAGPFQFAQYDPEDGTVIEAGYVRGPVARITSEDHGKVVEAKYTRWSHDPQVTIFWLRRVGEPYPALRPADDGSQQPAAPERYPLITAYDETGKVICQERLRPQGITPN